MSMNIGAHRVNNDQQIQQTQLNPTQTTAKPKYYNKIEGAIREIFGQAAKIRDESGKERYVNKEDLFKYAYAQAKIENYEGHVRVKLGEENGHALKNDLMEGIMKRGKIKDEFFTRIKTEMKDELKTQTVSIDEFCGRVFAVRNQMNREEQEVKDKAHLENQRRQEILGERLRAGQQISSRDVIE